MAGKQREKLGNRDFGFILEQGSLTIQEFERLCPDVNRRSLQRDLKAMVEKGVVAEKATSPTDPTKRYVLEEALRGDSL